MNNHKFWNKELVIQDTSENPNLSQQIKNLTISDYPSNPYKLPNDYEWYDLDLNNENDIEDLYQLLANHYVEEEDEIYRADYSKTLLKWALMPPNYKASWHIGIRVKNNKKLVAFISGIPSNVSIYDEIKKMVIIDFLCVHKKLRSKRLTPVLIKEISRRAARKEYFQAIYTCGKYYQKELAKMCYFHRTINVQKMIDIEFQSLKQKMTMKLTKRLYALPEQPTLNIRPLEEKDIPKVFSLFQSYISQFKVYPIFNEEDFRYWFLPKDKDILYCNVVLNETNDITDMFSFFCLPSKILKHKNKHSKFRSAFSFYNITTKTSYKDLIENSLIMAKNNNFDIYTCLDIMENETVFSELKFGRAGGNLFLYLYNWQAPILEPKDVGVVLI